ncbi:hypothetical protein EB008_05025 [bacterium]|jgi:hypothetical protein|nr:hypothetical protein [Chlamydiota bacterium]NDD99636.1 hypothetical protein [bacterium]
MPNPGKLERAFEEFFSDLSFFNHDGIINIDLPLLRDHNLLNCNDQDQDLLQQHPFYFHVIEEEDKVTLFNHQFAVWIVPQQGETDKETLTLIAYIEDETPLLDLVFRTAGIYNSPKYILRALRHFLKEIMDNEDVLQKMIEEF